MIHQVVKYGHSCPVALMWLQKHQGLHVQGTLGMDSKTSRERHAWALTQTCRLRPDLRQQVEQQSGRPADHVDLVPAMQPRLLPPRTQLQPCPVRRPGPPGRAYPQQEHRQVRFEVGTSAMATNSTSLGRCITSTVLVPTCTSISLE